MPESTCSLLQRAYPNGRTMEAVKAARAAGSQFVRTRMLAHAVSAASMHPNAGNANTFLSTTRRFHRKRGYGALPHGCPWPLTFLHPNERNANAFLPTSRRFHRKMGYGALPHVHPWPLTFPHSNDGNANAFLPTSRHFHRKKGYGALPHVHPWPLTFPRKPSGQRNPRPYLTAPRVLFTICLRLFAII